MVMTYVEETTNSSIAEQFGITLVNLQHEKIKRTIMMRLFCMKNVFR
jgi:hypothetical protein